MPSLHLNVGMLRDQRGIALPMALLALLILSSLVIAFSLLAASEPVIATNQKMVAQARAVAESGLEQAIWALNNGAGDASPYDGLTAIPIFNSGGTQIGVAKVTVTPGAATNERIVVSVGWVPTEDTSAASKAAHQKIRAKVSRFRFAASPPPASLTVAGEINVNGNTNIDSRSDTSCGAKDGTWSQGSTAYEGSGDIYGADGNSTKNQTASGLSVSPPSPITDIRQSVSASAFDPYTLKNADLNTLKALAKASGTYFGGPGVASLSFDASQPLPLPNTPNGVPIILIDTTDGKNIDYNPDGTVCSGCTDPSHFANVTINGGADGAGNLYKGMIIVAGSLAISGDFHMHGMVYVINDLTYTGTGTGEIDGAVFSQNIRDTSATTIDTNTGGNASIIYNCNYAKNPGGKMPQSFTIEPGTYKECSDTDVCS